MLYLYARGEIFNATPNLQWYSSKYIKVKEESSVIIQTQMVNSLDNGVLEINCSPVKQRFALMEQLVSQELNRLSLTVWRGMS